MPGDLRPTHAKIACHWRSSRLSATFAMAVHSQKGRALDLVSDSAASTAPFKFHAEPLLGVGFSTLAESMFLQLLARPRHSFAFFRSALIVQGERMSLRVSHSALLACSWWVCVPALQRLPMDYAITTTKSRLAAQTARYGMPNWRYVCHRLS